MKETAPNRREARSVVYTIGHSTRSAEEFVEMLRAHAVQMLVDVRTIPRSRHNPQFNTDSLSKTLADASIRYVHMPSLGGLRKPSPASVNLGWRNESFRGYADYMQTPAFAAAIDRLIELATHRQAAIMCAEAVPWRCHRSLVSDALMIRGVDALEIVSATSVTPHKLTPFARVNGVEVTYPPEGLPL